MDASRQKIFRAGLTRDFGILAAALIVVGLITIELGFIFETAFSGKGIILVALGGLCIAAVFMPLYHVTGCFIVVTPEEITYQDRWSRVTIPWHEASDFHEPLPDQKLFRNAHVLNDKVKLSVSSLSFVKFDTICSVIRLARRSKYYHDDLYSL